MRPFEMPKFEVETKTITQSELSMYSFPVPPEMPVNLETSKLNELEFLSWSDLGAAAFDENPLTFKMSGLVKTNKHPTIPKYFTFGEIRNDTHTIVYHGDVQEVFPFCIYSDVWEIHSWNSFKTIEEAKHALNQEYKKFVLSLFTL